MAPNQNMIMLNGKIYNIKNKSTSENGEEVYITATEKKINSAYVTKELNNASNPMDYARVADVVQNANIPEIKKNSLLKKIYIEGNNNNFFNENNNVNITVPQGVNGNMGEQYNMNRSIQVKNNKLVKNEIPKINSEFKKGTRVIKKNTGQQGSISKIINDAYYVKLNNNFVSRKETKLSKNQIRKK